VIALRVVVVIYMAEKVTHTVVEVTDTVVVIKTSFSQKTVIWTVICKLAGDNGICPGDVE
jgi:hypothetical protein